MTVVHYNNPRKVMRTQSSTSLKSTLKPHFNSQHPLAGVPALGDSTAEPIALLTQKERALIRLSLALGVCLKAQLLHYVERALEAGWTEAEIGDAAQVVMDTFSQPEVLTAARWVLEFQHEHSC